MSRSPEASAPVDVHAAAARATAGTGERLPYADEISAALGGVDLSYIHVHRDSAAQKGAAAIGASAFASGNAIVLGDKQDKHTVAHEVAHVLQQRAGVSLLGGVGTPGDSYEQNADAIADRVVAGRSAVDLLPATSASSPGFQPGRVVQRVAAATTAASASQSVAQPVAGMNATGFIDSSDGANLRTAPREAGGVPVVADPLPPATRVFVSGSYPGASQWLYVTAFLPAQIVRGYVQHFRVNTALPEPLATLYQVKAGDTAQKVVARAFAGHGRDGHDLRYFENVLLYTNRGRAGIRGSMNDPGAFAPINFKAAAKGRDSDIELVAGHRIWIVSPGFAQTLQGVIPDASLTNGTFAKAKRFVGHISDLIASVTESRNHLGEVAGQYAQAIRDHMPEIIGIIAGFIAAEAASAFLAASPTGVGQIAAVVIQLALSAFGAAAMVEASAAALQHATVWLNTAWTAHGDATKITMASKEFLHMLVSLAMAALSYTGAKGNFNNALKIVNTMPPMGMAPALAVVGGGQMPGALAAGTGVKLGMPGPQATVGTAMAMSGKPEGGGATAAADSVEQSARAAAGSATKNEVGKFTFDAADKAAVEARVRVAAHTAAADAYRKAIAEGKAAGAANTAATKAATAKARELATFEAIQAAEQKAAAAIRDGKALSARVDAQTTTQAGRFNQGQVGQNAKRLAPELCTLKETELIAKMKAEVAAGKATERTVAIGGPPPQNMSVFEYADGTVVRFKPLGDANRTQATFSIEVKKNAALLDAGQESAAFKVTQRGSIVPKGPADIANPFDRQRNKLQYDAFEKLMMDSGHQKVSK